jgi:hypothetical protein
MMDAIPIAVMGCHQVSFYAVFIDEFFNFDFDLFFYLLTGWTFLELMDLAF